MKIIDKVNKRDNKFISILLSLLVLLDFILVLGLSWVINKVGVVSIDEVIFHLRVPLKGTSHDMIYDVVKSCVIPSLIVFIVSLICLLKNYKNDYFISIKLFKINYKAHVKRVVKLLIFIFGIIIFALQLRSIDKKFNVFSYIKNRNIESTFIEENYVDSSNTKISFNGEKRNLVYIFLESMESTFFDKDDGGLQDVNLIPELTLLAQEYTNFSDNDKLGGAYQTNGATWTIGAMVAQTSGVPLLLPIQGNSISDYDSFMPGLYTLGDILADNGYNQMVMFGSDAEFGGRKTYYETHGNVVVKDLITAKEEDFIPDDYYVFWGIEDSKLFDYAKSEITKLSEDSEPFSFSLLTVNSHFPDGYVEDECSIDTGNSYADSITCSSSLVYDFVTWLQRQSFYDNTTIIVVGDHMSMAQNEILGGKTTTERKIYNVIINSAVNTDNTKNRVFTSLDMFPTTLASIGASIEGDRLGLGTNLYSDKKTLAEEYGFEYMNNELSMRSNFYNKKILYKK